MQTHINNLNNFKGIERIHIFSKEEIFRKHINGEMTIIEASTLLNIKLSDFIKEKIIFKKSLKSIKSLC
jgi:hypothetical protein